MGKQSEKKEPKPKKEPKTFETWYNKSYLPKVDLNEHHNPDAHGCLDAHPVCELCDKKIPNAKVQYGKH